MLTTCSHLQAASGRAKRRNITPDSPHINASPDNSHERPHAGVVPAALIGEARVQADQEYQRRLRAPDLRSAAIRDLSTMFTSALNEAFASDFHIVQYASASHTTLLPVQLVALPPLCQACYATGAAPLLRFTFHLV